MLAACLCSTSSNAQAAGTGLEDLLSRTSHQAEAFLERFSDVKCTEKVTQEKLNQAGKIEKSTDSTYDYLVILSNSGGESEPE